jgi:hypothetical protein
MGEFKFFKLCEQIKEEICKLEKKFTLLSTYKSKLKIEETLKSKKVSNKVSKKVN